MTTAGNQANICTYKHTWTSHIVCSALHTATINQNKFSHTSKSCVEIKAKLGKLFMAAPHYTKTTPIHWIQSIVCTNLSKCNASLNICHFFSPLSPSSSNSPQQMLRSQKKILPMLRCKCKSCWGHILFACSLHAHISKTCLCIEQKCWLFWLQLCNGLLCWRGTPLSLSHLLVCNIRQQSYVAFSPLRSNFV